MHRRIVSSAVGALAGVAILAGCSTTNYTAPQAVAVPDVTNLSYMLQLGSPSQASGVLLSWTIPVDTVYAVSDFAVYGRGSSGSWQELGITTSNTFYDNETPQPWYLVVAEDSYGDQSPGDSIPVSTAVLLPPPASINGTPYDTAVALTWPATPLASPNAADFSYYIVYSDSATGSGPSATCSTDLSDFEVEGTTVSTAFVITGLANDDTRCYGVSSVSLSGQESEVSPLVPVEPTSSDPVFGTAALLKPIFAVVHHQSMAGKHTTYITGRARRM